MWAVGCLGVSIAMAGAQAVPAPAAGTTMTVLAPGAVGVGASPAASKMSFDFADPALSPAAYHLEFDDHGVGRYHSEPGKAAPADAHQGGDQPFDQQIEVSVPLREQLLALANSRHLQSGDCESKKSKVAFTGNKTITYDGPGGHYSCTFNWSQDPQLMKAADDFIAISLTLQEGRRLRLYYLHDRLSLDGELETLANAVKNGTALEVENIREELEAISSDQAVMKRAQARAAALLAGAIALAENAALQPR